MVLVATSCTAEAALCREAAVGVPVKLVLQLTMSIVCSLSPCAEVVLLVSGWLRKVESACVQCLHRLPCLHSFILMQQHGVPLQ